MQVKPSKFVTPYQINPQEFITAQAEISRLHQLSNYHHKICSRNVNIFTFSCFSDNFKEDEQKFVIQLWYWYFLQ